LKTFLRLYSTADTKMKKPKAFEWFGMLKFLYQKKPKAFEWFGMLKFLYQKKWVISSRETTLLLII
jgi:hypothetical protein